MSVISSSEAHLYRELLRQLSGPRARELTAALGGPQNVDVYLAVRKRLKERSEAGLSLELDGVDWAAIRTLAPIVLRTMSQTQFRTILGHDPEALIALQHRAIAQRRRFGFRKGWLWVEVGNECVVRLPQASLGGNTVLVGLPDEESWARVTPECVHPCRAEVLDEMRSHWNGRVTVLWEERRVSSLPELEEWVRGAAASSRLNDP